jgi:hypothetical protein
MRETAGRLLKFRGAKSVCRPCPLRARCLTTPDTTDTKQVTIFLDKTEAKRELPIERMKRKFDTPLGRFTYSSRIAIVEPVFANVQNKGVRPIFDTAPQIVSATQSVTARRAGRGTTPTDCPGRDQGVAASCLTVGGRATPTAWNTAPQVPLAWVRRQKRLFWCVTSTSCSASRSWSTSAHSSS